MRKAFLFACTVLASGQVLGATAGTASKPVAQVAGGPSGVSARLNSIDTVVADMKLRNDFVLKGYESFTSGWYVGPGENHMGNNPSFSNFPKWSFYHENPSYAGKIAKTTLPWVVLFDGVKHAASNVAVEMRNMRTYIKSRSTGKWVHMGGPVGLTGSNYGKPSTDLPETKETVVRQSATSSVIKLPEDRNYFWHGWWRAGHVPVSADDVDAIFVTLQARIVVADPSRSDDRASAQVGLQVGADYYVDDKTVYSESYAPAVGISRTKTVGNDWQAFNFITLSDVGTQQPGGGITEASLRTAPPPLE